MNCYILEKRATTITTLMRKKRLDDRDGMP